MKKIIILMTLGLIASSANAASFDCNKASTNIESLICRDAVLSSLDERLAEAYRVQLSSSESPQTIKTAQRQWLADKVRKCDSVDCVRVEYIRRINELETKSLQKEVSAAPSEEILKKSPEPVIVPEPVQPTVEVKSPEPATNVESVIEVPSAATTNVAEPQVVPEKPKVQAVAPSGNSKPPSAISDIFEMILMVFGVIIIAAFIRPKWVMRWESEPTRKTVALYLLPLGFIIGGLGQLTRTDERKAYDNKIAHEKKSIGDEANQQRYAQSQGIELYKSYKSVAGNADRANYNEDEYINGTLISTCNISGKPRGKYGWIEFRTVFMEGQRLKDMPIIKMYIFAVGDAPTGSVAWRGEQYASQLVDLMQRTCD